MEGYKDSISSRSSSPGILKPPRTNSRPSSLILNDDFLHKSEFKNDLAQISAEYKALQLKVELLNCENEGLKKTVSELQQIATKQNTTFVIDANQHYDRYRYHLPLTVMAFGFVTALITIIVLFFVQRHLILVHEATTRNS